jgi:hypothetical protein
MKFKQYCHNPDYSKEVFVAVGLKHCLEENTCERHDV